MIYTFLLLNMIEENECKTVDFEEKSERTCHEETNCDNNKPVRIVTGFGQLLCNAGRTGAGFTKSGIKCC